MIRIASNSSFLQTNRATLDEIVEGRRDSTTVPMGLRFQAISTAKIEPTKYMLHATCRFPWQ